MKAVFLATLLCLFCLVPLNSSIANHHAPLDFTEAEKNWLKQHPVIYVANEMDWVPFDYNLNGKPQGFSIEYFDFIAQRIGLKVEYVYGHSWAELVELFRQRKIDVMPVMYMNEERKQFTLFTQPYYQAKLGIFINKDAQSWDGSLKRKRVGMDLSHGSIPLVKSKVPDINLIEVEGNFELVKALATSQLDVIIGNPMVFYDHAKRNQITNIELVDFVLMTPQQQQETAFHIGVRSDWPMLHQIFEKAIAASSDFDMVALENRWAGVVVVDETDWNFVIKVTFAVLLVILFLVWHNQVLKKMVLRRTAELNELNASLEHAIADRTEELQQANAELIYLNKADGLTQIYNRRYFDEQLDVYWRLHIRNAQPISLLMIDIDHFKEFNDKYGHLVGDDCLRSVAKILHGNLNRSADFLARYGGEEFVVITEADSRDAVKLAEKLRKAVAKLKTEHPMSITISIGVATMIAKIDQPVEALIAHADQALYRSKKQGRNQVTAYQALEAEERAMASDK